MGYFVGTTEPDRSGVGFQYYETREEALLAVQGRGGHIVKALEVGIKKENNDAEN